MEIELIKAPSAEDWMLVRRAALKTIGKKPITEPGMKWKRDILVARHSPIRLLEFVFDIRDIPYWVSNHLVRHVHATPFVRSQRNDRQGKYDRNAARQDAPVDMMWAMNAEELCVIANKRLCLMAAKETREVVQTMCDLVVDRCPEFKEVLVPMCEYYGICHEMNGGCGKLKEGGE